MNNDVCPCLYCHPPERYPGCHDTCIEKYIPWKAREAARKASMPGGSVSDAYAAEAVNRNRCKKAKYMQNQRMRKHKKT